MINQAYKNYFCEDDYDDVEYHMRKQLQKKILIFSLIGIFLSVIIIFNVLAFTLENPYQSEKNTFKNDFSEVDKIIESNNNFNNTPYYP